MGGRGAKVFLQVLTDQLPPNFTMWGTLLLALQIFRSSDIPVNFIFLSRFTILSTYHYLFFFFFFFFIFHFFFKFCPEIIKPILRRFGRIKNEKWKRKKVSITTHDPEHVFFLFFILFSTFVQKLWKAILKRFGFMSRSTNF